MKEERKFFEDEVRFLDIRDNSKVVIFIIVDHLIYQRWKEGELIYSETLLQTGRVEDLEYAFKSEIQALEEDPNYIRLI